MADEIIIRECGEDEGQVVLSLWQQGGDVVLSPTDSLEEVQAAIHHSAALFLVPESEGRIMGSIIGTWDGRRGEFYRLAVSPEVRRREWPGCWWTRRRSGWPSNAATESPPW